MMDQREQVAPEAAEVLGGDYKYGISSDRGVDSVAPSPKYVARHGRGQQIDRRDHGSGSVNLYILGRDRHCRSMTHD